MEFFEIKIADSFSAGSVHYIAGNQWEEDGKKIGLCVVDKDTWENFVAASGTCNLPSASSFTRVNNRALRINTAVKKIR